MSHLTKILISGLLILFIFSSAYADEKTILASGYVTAKFKADGQPSVEGRWQIYTDGQRYFIELLDDFRAKEGPDVKIFVSAKKERRIEGYNAARDSIFVSNLRSFSGTEIYEIPEDVNIENLKTLIFHCEFYSKLWGTSVINQK